MEPKLLVPLVIPTKDRADEICRAIDSILRVRVLIVKEDYIASLAERMAKTLPDAFLARKMGAKSKEMIEKHFLTEICHMV